MRCPRMYPRADRHDTGPAGDLQHSGAAAEKQAGP